MQRYRVTVINPWTGTRCNSYFWTLDGANRFASRHPYSTVNEIDGDDLPVMVGIVGVMAVIVLGIVIGGIGWAVYLVMT